MDSKIDFDMMTEEDVTNIRKRFNEEIQKFCDIFTNEIVPIMKKHDIKPSVSSYTFGGLALKIAEASGFNMTDEELFDNFKKLKSRLDFIIGDDNG